VAPAVTVFFGESGGFSEDTSQILALEALSEVGPKSREIIQRQQVIDGQMPGPDIQNPPFLNGRTLTIRVDAKRAGAEMQRAVILELTGDPKNPYWLRYLN
jgi:hypothetical protein